MSNCPNCNEKLSPFYFKQNCPHCGANLMYYDFDNRLQQDAEKVAREAEHFAETVEGIKRSTIRSAAAIIRLLSFILPIVALLLPVFRVGGENITLISIIKMVISDSGSVLGNTALALCLADFIAVILCALVALVNSLFSFTKSGLKRNVIISALGIIFFAGLYIAVIAAGGGVAYGFFLVLVLEILTVALHFAVNKRIKELELIMVD